jgi:hypothetical protein
MAGILNTVYVVLALIVAVVGVVAVMWVTRTSGTSERNTSGYVIALAVVIFLLAMVGSLLT